MTRTIKMVAYHRAENARAAALILPGGADKSRGRYWSIVDFALRSLARGMADAGERDALAVYLVRYRYRGWNGADADTLVDTREALDRIRRKHGEIPVALVGNSLGGRAAFHAADDPTVASVV